MRKVIIGLVIIILVMSNSPSITNASDQDTCCYDAMKKILAIEPDEGPLRILKGVCLKD